MVHVSDEMTLYLYFSQAKCTTEEDPQLEPATFQAVKESNEPEKESKTKKKRSEKACDVEVSWPQNRLPNAAYSLCEVEKI